MSFFGTGARAGPPAGQLDQQRLGEAAMELEAVSDLFNRIVSSCHTKCISTRYAEPELNKGEGVCVDRCVAKYFAANEKVQERLQKSVIYSEDFYIGNWERTRIVKGPLLLMMGCVIAMLLA